MNDRGGAGCLTSLIKQHKWFESQAITTLAVYREHKIRFKNKNKYKGIQSGYRPFTHINMIL